MQSVWKSLSKNLTKSISNLHNHFTLGVETMHLKKLIIICTCCTLSFNFLALLTSCSSSGQDLAGPNNLRTEYQENPMGIDVLNPRFSWNLNDSRRGAAQTAYQIIVASAENILENNEADIWDSGKLDSDQSTHVVYNGPTLLSGTRYY